MSDPELRPPLQALFIAPAEGDGLLPERAQEVVERALAAAGLLEAVTIQRVFVAGELPTDATPATADMKTAADRLGPLRAGIVAVRNWLGLTNSMIATGPDMNRTVLPTLLKPNKPRPANPGVDTILQIVRRLHPNSTIAALIPDESEQPGDETS